MWNNILNLKLYGEWKLVNGEEVGFIKLRDVSRNYFNSLKV